MLQDTPTETINAGQSAYVTLTAVQHQGGSQEIAGPPWALSRSAFSLARAASSPREKRRPGWSNASRIRRCLPT